MLTPSTLLQNRYRILRQIGGGGMGVVYLAEDTRLAGRKCAIKEMSPAQLAPRDRNWAINAFRQEAQMLANLSHPGLTAVTDFFPEGSNWYLVMDYVEGETLKDRLERARGGRLPLQETLGIVRQLCNVLEYLHGQTPPVVFRDLKPGNVMLTPTGEVKLIDFGIARFFKPGQARDTVNLGTPGYAAPEQYGSLSQTDPRSDIYGLGALLHQMVTGHDPTTTPFNLPPPRQLNPRISPRIEATIQQALQAEPSQRLRSVQEMQWALQSSPPPPPFPWKIVAGVGGVLVALLACGAIFAYAITHWPASTSTPQPTSIAPTAGATQTPVVIVLTPTPLSSTSTSTPTPTPLPATSTPAPTPTPTPAAYMDGFDTLDDNIWHSWAKASIDLYTSDGALHAERSGTYTPDWGESAGIRLKQQLNFTGVGTTVEWRTTVHADARWTLIYGRVVDAEADRYLAFDCSTAGGQGGKFNCVINLRQCASGSVVWNHGLDSPFTKGTWYTFEMVNPEPQRVDFYVNGAQVVSQTFSDSQWNGMGWVKAEWYIIGWPSTGSFNNGGYPNVIHTSLDYFSHGVQ